MNKPIIGFAAASCFALGATLAHAESDGSNEGSEFTQNATTPYFDDYETYDVHGGKQFIPKVKSEGE